MMWSACVVYHRPVLFRQLLAFFARRLCAPVYMMARTFLQIYSYSSSTSIFRLFFFLAIYSRLLMVQFECRACFDWAREFFQMIQISFNDLVLYSECENVFLF